MMQYKYKHQESIFTVKLLV